MKLLHRWPFAALSLVVGTVLPLLGDAALAFPSIQGTNLEGQTVSLPGDFGAPAALVFVAFQRRQQREVEAWKPEIVRLRTKFPGLKVWELPTVGAGYKFMRGVIDGGMRSGIPDAVTRAATVTLYIDVEPFAMAVGARDRSTISALVVAPDGRIMARAAGIPNETSVTIVEDALASVFGKAASP
ncbi:MAG TPA: hypothetical protein VMC79_09125 [Rectinemataceae bacterium]|nr:hypothetical protein [Rectinemataceae bacterium]